LIPLNLIELIIAKTVVLVLGGEIVFQEPVLILFENFSVQISYLCTGLMEFILLASALIATFGIEKEKKIIGIIGAGIATFLFNVVRIIITISLIENSSMETIELAHDILFRISLFVLIAGYYFLWYYFSVKK
jgi:exosortase/archaeosortase family protein